MNAVTLQLGLEQLVNMYNTFPEMGIIGLKCPVQVVKDLEEVNGKPFICQGNE